MNSPTQNSLFSDSWIGLSLIPTCSASNTVCRWIVVNHQHCFYEWDLHNLPHSTSTQPPPSRTIQLDGWQIWLEEWSNIKEKTFVSYLIEAGARLVSVRISCKSNLNFVTNSHHSSATPIQFRKINKEEWTDDGAYVRTLSGDEKLLLSLYRKYRFSCLSHRESAGTESTLLFFCWPQQPQMLFVKNLSSFSLVP